MFFAFNLRVLDMKSTLKDLLVSNNDMIFLDLLSRLSQWSATDGANPTFSEVQPLRSAKGIGVTRKMTTTSPNSTTRN